jgi:hypothetical protein
MNTNILWHPEIAPSRQWKVLEGLAKTSLLNAFYLAGGTGLALALGHRRSRDFDFFSAELFDEDMLVQKLRPQVAIKVVSKAPHTLHLEIDGVKVTLLGYAYPLLFPTLSFRREAGIQITVADVRDIACMKISALASRGSRRDFIDLYAVSRQHRLAELLGLFGQKFAGISFNRLHILKSLTYFDDAEREPMPEMLTDVSWDNVKNAFLSEVPLLLKL